MRGERANMLRIAVALAGLAVARPVLADEPSQVADPTAVTRIVEKAPEPAPPDPCEIDPRCRVARFRAMLAHQRRQEYILRVEAASRAMEEQLWKERPFRLRYPWSIDLLVVTNLALPGGAVGFAPIWFFKMEAYVARYDHSNYYYDSNTMDSGNANINGYAFGSYGKFTPLRFPLSPYVTLGWGYVGAKLNYYSYEGETNITTDATAHLITAGVGLDLVVPYFHISAGYLFAHAFYVQSSINSMHDENSKPIVRNVMDDNHHGFSLSIGSAF
jgi:hypothetical protein